jgi:hypothetical protein
MTENDQQPVPEQQFYLSTGLPGIYVCPVDFDGYFLVVSGIDGQWKKEWNSKWRHNHLKVSTKPRRDDQAIPGLFIAYEELQHDLPLIQIGVPRTGPGYCYTRCSLTDKQLDLMEEVINDIDEVTEDDNDDGGHAPLSSSNNPRGESAPEMYIEERKSC